MLPEQEIARIQMEYKDHWQKLEKLPAILKAIADNDPITLGKVAAEAIYGNRWKPTKQDLEAGAQDTVNYEMDKLRADLIRKKKPM